MIIQEAAEMYLETILILKKRNGSVRSIDIANEMNYSKPTVSEQMKKFRQNGYIKMDPNGYISMTEKGLSIAENTYEKHLLLAGFLVEIGVDEKTAYEDACRMEHYISDKTFECIKNHYRKLSPDKPASKLKSE